MPTVVENINSWNQRNIVEQARNRKEELEEHSRQMQDKESGIPVMRDMSMDDVILEGKGSNECSCRVTDMTALGEPVFTCQELQPGDCMYRVGSEPDLKCLYCLERYEGDRVRKACIREEAQEYARFRMYEDTLESSNNN